MKKRILALLLAGTLTLSGCANMTSREYLSIQPHNDPLTTEEDPAIRRAETYQELVSGIYLMVKDGVSHGVIHMANYTAKDGNGDVESDLAAACTEVAQRDPLGAYAVDFIKHEKSYIVSYYEADINITYRRTRDQVKSIISVTGSSAIRSELQEALSGFSTEKVLRISYFNEDTNSIQALIRQAYYSTPQFAMGMPGIQVTIYPSVGMRQVYTDPLRIVEILLTYPESQEILRKQALDLATKAEAMGDALVGLGREERAQGIYRSLQKEVSLLVPRRQGTPLRSDTAYAALVEGWADSEGMALAFQLLCQQAGVESYVVSGGVENSPHFWNIVALPDGEYRHVDATLAEGFGLSDADMVALGYAWDRAEYRICGTQPPETEVPVPAAAPGMPLEVSPEMAPETAENKA